MGCSSDHEFGLYVRRPPYPPLPLFVLGPVRRRANPFGWGVGAGIVGNLLHQSNALWVDKQANATIGS